jgi:hypothetical protein
MENSRFQFGLVTALAVGLGFSLASSQAVGYPSSAVSLGQSPVVASGGTVFKDTSETVFSAVGQDVVLTDLSLTSSGQAMCKRMHKTTLTLTSTGETVGEFQTNSAGGLYHSSGGFQSSAAQTVSMNYGSGIRIAAGDTLTMTVEETGRFGYSECSSSEGSGQGVRFAASGYYAQP